MATLASIVDLVHPTVSGTGVITSDEIWILFDREIDESTITAGGFFVTGPDFDTWSGPDLQLFLDREQTGDEEEILQSPSFHGIVQGTISFEKIDLDALTEVSGTDTEGSGHLYRTKALLTPTNRLQSDTEYRVYISGDEDDTDTLKTGISSRTVFDAVASGENIGSGEVSFTGGYTGLVEEDVYRIQITTSGEVGSAKFTFVRDSDPLSVYGPFKTKQSEVLLSDGVSVEFSDAIYPLGEQWSVVVKERDIFTGNITWPFMTGSGSIQELPTTTATSVIGDPVTSTSSTSSTSFEVSSTDPEDGETNVDIVDGEQDVTIVFDSTIDASSIVSGVDYSIYAESVTGETDVSAEGELIVSYSVDADTLTLTIASGLLCQNNLVTVTLDSSIKNESGVSLGSDYTFSFTTTYYPMYCTLRRMRVYVGAYISNVADDTVNLAIHLASKEADALTWNTANLTDEYFMFARSQWTCCRTAQILLTNTIGGAGSLKSKKLGDLAVEYNTSVNVMKPLANAEDCMRKWEGTLMAGGRQVHTASMVVKGDYDVDKPPTGRGWIHNRSLVAPKNPAANTKSQVLGSRRYRHIFSGNRGWWDR